LMTRYQVRKTLVDAKENLRAAGCAWKE